MNSFLFITFVFMSIPTSIMNQMQTKLEPIKIQPLVMGLINVEPAKSQSTNLGPFSLESIPFNVGLQETGFNGIELKYVNDGTIPYIPYHHVCIRSCSGQFQVTRSFKIRCCNLGWLRCCYNPFPLYN